MNYVEKDLNIQKIRSDAVALAISRSEKLTGLDRLSILMEFKEWICFETNSTEILAIPDLTSPKKLSS